MSERLFGLFAPLQEHLKSWAHPGDKDWFTVAAATARKHLKLEVTLAGASPAALKAAEPHFEEADGYRGGAPVASVTLYMAHHTGLLQQFLKQVLAKVQQFIHLKPTASVLTPEQFCVVLQASREVARMMDGGATVSTNRDLHQDLISRGEISEMLCVVSGG